MLYQGVAQLVARSVRDAEVVGSSPITLTSILYSRVIGKHGNRNFASFVNGSSPITLTIKKSGIGAVGSAHAWGA